MSMEDDSSSEGKPTKTFKGRGRTLDELSSNARCDSQELLRLRGTYTICSDCGLQSRLDLRTFDFSPLHHDQTLAVYPVNSRSRLPRVFRNKRNVYEEKMERGGLVQVSPR